eukprot:TRINITY_DN4452_c0_g1_i2.p1 TRINITY_DN4452_c0_g1~~TRINITY_DN4452_c0_g1_i2.p1  ORF type:complete len:1368 (+),score=398.31 TRINITY_DN4452_c0_g1_i2:96-4106(+)
MFGRLMQRLGTGTASRTPSKASTAPADSLHVSRLLNHSTSGARLVAWDGGCQVLAVCTATSVTVYGVNWARVVVPTSASPSDITSIVFIPGRGALVCVSPLAVDVCDVRGGGVDTAHAAGGVHYTCAGVVHGEDYILVGTQSGTVAVLNPAAEKTQVAVDVAAAACGAGEVAEAAASRSIDFVLGRPHHLQLAIAASEAAGLVQVLLPAGELSARFTAPGGARFTSACLCPRDKWLIASDTSARVLVWKATADPDLKHGRAIHCLQRLAAGGCASSLSAGLSPTHPADENAVWAMWVCGDSGRIEQADLRPKDKQQPVAAALYEGGAQAAVPMQPMWPEQATATAAVAAIAPAGLVLIPYQAGTRYAVPLSPFGPPSRGTVDAALIPAMTPAQIHCSVPGGSDLSGLGGVSPFRSGRGAHLRRDPAVSVALAVSASGDVSACRFSAEGDCLCRSPPLQLPPPLPGSSPSSAGDVQHVLGGTAILRVRGGGVWLHEVGHAAAPVPLPTPPGACSASYIPAGAEGCGAAVVVAGQGTQVMAVGRDCEVTCGDAGEPAQPEDCAVVAAWRAGAAASGTVLWARGCADGSTELRLLRWRPAQAAWRPPAGAQPPPDEPPKPEEADPTPPPPAPAPLPAEPPKPADSSPPSPAATAPARHFDPAEVLGCEDGLAGALKAHPDWEDRLETGFFEDESPDDEVTREWVAERWDEAAPGHAALRAYVARAHLEYGLFKREQAEAPASPASASAAASPAAASASASPAAAQEAPPPPPPLAQPQPPRPPPGLAPPPLAGPRSAASPSLPSPAAASPLTLATPSCPPATPLSPADAEPESGLQLAAELRVPSAGGPAGAARRRVRVIRVPPSSSAAVSRRTLGFEQAPVSAGIRVPDVSAGCTVRVTLEMQEGRTGFALVDSLGEQVLSVAVTADGGSVGGVVTWHRGRLRPGGSPTTAEFGGLPASAGPAVLTLTFSRSHATATLGESSVPVQCTNAAEGGLYVAYQCVRSGGEVRAVTVTSGDETVLEIHDEPAHAPTAAHSHLLLVDASGCVVQLKVAGGRLHAGRPLALPGSAGPCRVCAAAAVELHDGKAVLVAAVASDLHVFALPLHDQPSAPICSAKLPVPQVDAITAYVRTSGAGLLLFAGHDAVHARLSWGPHRGAADRDGSDSETDDEGGARPPAPRKWEPFREFPPTPPRPALKVPGMGVFKSACFKDQAKHVQALREQIKAVPGGGAAGGADSFEAFQARIFTEDERKKMDEEASVRRAELLGGSSGARKTGAQGELAGTAAVMAENKERLAERGEKIKDFELKTQELEAETAEFHRLVAELAKRQREKKWWQL